MTEVSELPLDCIEPDPDQPRKYFDEQRLLELAESVKQHGLLQPISVRPKGDGKYMIIHGERRFRAHILANLKTIKCIINTIDKTTVRDQQLVENLARNDLSEMELAFEFQRRVKEGQTHEQIANTIGKTRAFVTQRLALLQLSKETQDRLLRGELSFSNARTLLTIKDENLRNKIGQQMTSGTTAIEAACLVKQENVTRVTMNAKDTIVVEELFLYRLISNRKIVSKSELLTAIGQDLQLLRGED